MLPLNEFLVLIAAGVVFYFFRRLRLKATPPKEDEDKVDVAHNKPDLFDESMKDIISPERHWNSSNIHNGNYHRNNDD